MGGAPDQPSQGPPMGAPQGQPPQAPDPAALAGARAHMKVVAEGLMELAGRPQGSLTKRDVFNALGEMIAQGAFSSPESKQQLVAQMAQMPDDESAIRQAIGAQLLQLGVMQDHMTQHFPEEAPDA